MIDIEYILMAMMKRPCKDHDESRIVLSHETDMILVKWMMKEDTFVNPGETLCRTKRITEEDENETNIEWIHVKATCKGCLKQSKHENELVRRGECIGTLSPCIHAVVY